MCNLPRPKAQAPGQLYSRRRGAKWGGEIATRGCQEHCRWPHAAQPVRHAPRRATAPVRSRPGATTKHSGRTQPCQPHRSSGRARHALCGTGPHDNLHRGACPATSPRGRRAISKPNLARGTTLPFSTTRTMVFRHGAPATCRRCSAFRVATRFASPKRSNCATHAGQQVPHCGRVACRIPGGGGVQIRHSAANWLQLCPLGLPTYRDHVAGGGGVDAAVAGKVLAAAHQKRAMPGARGAARQVTTPLVAWKPFRAVPHWTFRRC